MKTTVLDHRLHAITDRAGSREIHQEDQEAKSSSFHDVGHRKWMAVRIPSLTSEVLTVVGTVLQSAVSACAQ